MKTEIRGWLQSEAFRYFQHLQPSAARDVECELNRLIQQICLSPVSDLQDIDGYYSHIAAAEQLSGNIMAQFEQLTQKETQRYEVHGDQNKQFMSTQKIEGILAAFDDATPVATLVSSFSFDGDMQQLKAQLLVFARYFSQYTASSHDKLAAFSQKAVEYLFACVNREDLASAKDTVKRTLESILNEHQEYLRVIRERASLYDDYCALSSIQGATPRPAGAFASVKALEAEIERLQTAYKKKDEMDFIATQINQVMIDLGYQFVSSTSLQRQNGSEYDYSLYQADEETGISIYTDESGAVMMQLTTIGEGAITAQDEEENYQRQLDFCASHPDIVNALMEKGVFLKQTNYEPPDRKHTKKTTVKVQASTKVVDRRKRRRVKPKMRTM